MVPLLASVVLNQSTVASNSKSGGGRGLLRNWSIFLSRGQLFRESAE
jgi:hypothetical protein